jgi:hypothetical protein
MFSHIHSTDITHPQLIFVVTRGTNGSVVAVHGEAIINYHLAVGGIGFVLTRNTVIRVRTSLPSNSVVPQLHHILATRIVYRLPFPNKTTKFSELPQSFS